MGKLVRRVLEGYEPVMEWSPDDPSSVDAARERLKEEIEAGYVATSGFGGDSDNESVTELPVDADTVILTMPMGGG